MHLRKESYNVLVSNFQQDTEIFQTNNIFILRINKQTNIDTKVRILNEYCLLIDTKI